MYNDGNDSSPAVAKTSCKVPESIMIAIDKLARRTGRTRQSLRNEALSMAVELAKGEYTPEEKYIRPALGVNAVMTGFIMPWELLAGIDQLSVAGRCSRSTVIREALAVYVYAVKEGLVTVDSPRGRATSAGGKKLKNEGVV